jgi:hypothetical protein
VCAQNVFLVSQPQRSKIIISKNFEQIHWIKIFCRMCGLAVQDGLPLKILIKFSCYVSSMNGFQIWQFEYIWDFWLIVHLNWTLLRAMAKRSNHAYARYGRGECSQNFEGITFPQKIAFSSPSTLVYYNYKYVAKWICKFSCMCIVQNCCNKVL